MAVKSAAAVRAMLRPVLPDATCRPMMYELDGAFRKWLQTELFNTDLPTDDLTSFIDFSFNKEARPGKVFKAVKASRFNENDLLVQLPEINPARDITAPKDTVKVELTFMTAALSFDNENHQGVFTANITLPYTESIIPAQEILLKDATGLRCLTLIAMSMRFYKSANEGLPINQNRWKPTLIVGSFYN
jgi:hypothetical protein